MGKIKGKSRENGKNSVKITIKKIVKNWKFDGNVEIRTTLKIKNEKMQIQKNFKDSEKSNFINIEKIG